MTERLFLDSFFLQYDCTAWTDVKHNLYLYQLEMSFVKELQHSKCLCAYQHSEQNQKDLNVPRKQVIDKEMNLSSFRITFKALVEILCC